MVALSILEKTPRAHGSSDWKCDMRDIGTVALHFGQAVPPADPNWDIYEDWKIDMRDIGIMARHFGEHYP
jgi:hypothetical protein